MSTLTSLSVLLEGDSSSLVKATRTGLGALKNFGAAAGKAVAVTAALGAGATLAAAGALTALGNAARSSIDAHAKNAARLGLTTAEAQELTIALGQSDVEMRTVRTAMAAITREAGMAANGAQKSRDKFSALGISMKEIETLSPLDLFRRVIGALGEVENMNQRAAAANALIGESWIKLNPLIEAGAGAFENASRIVRDLGLGVSDQASKDVENFNDKLDSMFQLGVSLRDKVFSTLAPELSKFADAAFNTAAAFIEANGGGEKFAQLLGTKLVEAIKSVVSFIGRLKEVYDALALIGEFGFKALSALGQLQGGVVATAGALLRGDFSGAAAIVKSIPGDVSAKFGGDAEEAVLDETKRQTQLLREIAEKEFGAAFG